MESLSKNKFKELFALKQAKARKEKALFVVEGEKVFSELQNSSFEIVLVCATENWIEKNNVEKFPFPIYKTLEKDLERLSFLTTPNQIWAVVKEKQNSKSLEFTGLTLVLDNVKDPGNMGTIIRTAEWFGVENIVCSPECVDIYNPKVVQSAMGSLFRVNILSQNLVPFLKNIPKEIPVYGATLGGKNIYETTFSQKGVVVMGSESHGISPEVLPLLSSEISIPKYGNSPIDSLNVSIATAVLCAEIQRQTSK